MNSLPKHTGSFDALRLLAAFAVLMSHSYALLGQENNDPLFVLSRGQVYLGEAAVYAFFAMSGFLITRSWLGDPDFKRFMFKRILRLVPALAVVMLASVALIGPLTSALAPQVYFAQAETWTYLTKIFIYPKQYGLPGVFLDNPYPTVVNGSLWTLRLEFALYLVVAVIGSLGLLRRRVITAGLALFFLAVSVWLSEKGNLSGLPGAHQVVVFFLNATPFFIGAALAQSDLTDKRHFYMAFGLVLLALLWVPFKGFVFPLVVALPYAVILGARSGRGDLFARLGDCSYGIYLWAFPIQQSLIHFLPTISLGDLMLLAGGLSFVCAMLSWRFVESKALAMKPRRARPVQENAAISTL